MIQRFPVKMHIYNQSVGRLLPRRICQILKDQGHKTWMNPKQGNGVDMKVWYRNKLILVAEVINWSIGSNLSDKRFRSMMSNFSSYNCAKVLIYTVLDKNKVQNFRNRGITTLEVGYQLLPRTFYNFFKQKGQVKKRRIDSRDTRKDLKYKIERFVAGISVLESLDRRTFMQLSDALSKYHMHQFDKFKRPKPDVKFIRKSIRYAVHWSTEILCREVRRSHYQGEKFTCSYVAKNIPTLLFHGTSTRFLDDIESNGLLPKAETEVFLTDNVLIAETYAYRAATRFGGSPVVLGVNVGHMKHKLTMQFDFYSKKSDDLVVLPYTQYLCSSISPDRVVGAYIPSSFTAVLFELMCILECVSNRTPEEEREIEYLRRIYYDRLK